MIPLLLIVGNMFMFIFFLIIKMLQVFSVIGDHIAHEYADGETSMSEIVNVFVNFLMFLFVQFIAILILFNDRKNEYNADEFALNNGYGADLIETLYVLEKFDFGGNTGLLDRLKDSHPNINNRIARLEQKLEKYNSAEELPSNKTKKYVGTSDTTIRAFKKQLKKTNKNLIKCGMNPISLEECLKGYEEE